MSKYLHKNLNEKNDKWRKNHRTVLRNEINYYAYVINVN